jgi:hypothetical protein
MPTLSVAPATINPIDPIAEAERITAELSTHIDQMVLRMQRALDTLAEACGAWHCDHCGSWTTEAIEVEDYSEELGRETDTHCPRCLPAGYREVA